MYSIFRWQKINFKTSQFNHFAFCRKSMTHNGHNVAKVFFATRPTNPIWVRVQRISSFFLSYCKQKFYHHFCKAWGFILCYKTREICHGVFWISMYINVEIGELYPAVHFHIVSISTRCLEYLQGISRSRYLHGHVPTGHWHSPLHTSHSTNQTYCVTWSRHVAPFWF